MAERSIFATILQRLFDDTGFYSRDQWANFLGISPETIENWINDEAIPVHHLLRMVLDLLRTRGNIAAVEPLKAFDEMAVRPAAEVSPHPKLLATVNDYLQQHFTDFAKSLRQAPADHQQMALTKGSWPL